MNKITSVTRKDIFDSILSEGVVWNGRIDELEFLGRIFDLKKLPSTDNRFDNATDDIRQHIIYNYDWSNEWVFTDSRFNLLFCDDSIFLQFLCEMIHPWVRADIVEIRKLEKLFNQYLSKDGHEITEKSQISGKPVFSGGQKLATENAMKMRTLEIVNHLTEDYVMKQINKMETAINSHPDLAIGTAKELIETICKTILEERKITVDKGWDLPKVLKETNKQLKLTPSDIPEEVKAADTIKSILGSLSNVVQGICELRNSYGTGHGKSSTHKGLNPRHAKLAVGAASTLAIFLLETHKIK